MLLPAFSHRHSKVVTYFGLGSKCYSAKTQRSHDPLHIVSRLWVGVSTELEQHACVNVQWDGGIMGAQANANAVKYHWTQWYGVLAKRFAKPSFKRPVWCRQQRLLRVQLTVLCVGGHPRVELEIAGAV